MQSQRCSNTVLRLEVMGLGQMHKATPLRELLSES